MILSNLKLTSTGRVDFSLRGLYKRTLFPINIVNFKQYISVLIEVVGVYVTVFSHGVGVNIILPFSLCADKVIM